MPCIGPTPAEQLDMEIANCKRLYGVADTELNIATRVACDLAAGRRTKLVERWTAEHRRRDAVRKAEQRQRELEEAAQRDIDAYAQKVRRKYKI